MASILSQSGHGPVVVIGGCGFIGFHIVDALRKDSKWGSVSVISRHPNINQCQGVAYHEGNICNEEAIQGLLASIKPRVIFHTAAPLAADPTIKPAQHYRTSVEGTKNVLAFAKSSPTVKAFVYTSTCAVSRGYQHDNLDETASLWEPDSKTIPYLKAKAFGDSLVREANTSIDRHGKGLLTAVIRVPFVYGERDIQTIPGMLKTAEQGQTKIQLGTNSGHVEPTYVGNVARAHLLAAEKLLALESGAHDLGVAGEAFNITDGNPQPFWTFARMIWQAAGDKTTPDQVTVIPAWLALSLAHGIDWAFYLCTLGKVRPPLNMSPLYIQYTIYDATYDIGKARERLGYVPEVDVEGHLRSSIAWEFENHPERYPKLLRK